MSSGKDPGPSCWARTMPGVFLRLLELSMALRPPCTPTISHEEQPWLSNVLIIRAYQAKREGKVSAEGKTQRAVCSTGKGMLSLRVAAALGQSGHGAGAGPSCLPGLSSLSPYPPPQAAESADSLT